MKLGIRHHFGHLYSKFIYFVGRILIAAVDNYHVIVSHSVIMDKAGAIHHGRKPINVPKMRVPML